MFTDVNVDKGRMSSHFHTYIHSSTHASVWYQSFIHSYIHLSFIIHPCSFLNTQTLHKNNYLASLIPVMRNGSEMFFTEFGEEKRP